MTVDATKSQAYLTSPTVKSTDADWMKWADLVENKYGVNLGKQIFVAKWNKSGSQAANTYALRQYILKNYNIQIDENVFNKLADLGGGIADTFGKIFKVGKITLIVIGVGVALAVVGAIVSVVKNPGILKKAVV